MDKNQQGTEAHNIFFVVKDNLAACVHNSNLLQWVRWQGYVLFSEKTPFIAETSRKGNKISR